MQRRYTSGELKVLKTVRASKHVLYYNMQATRERRYENTREDEAMHVNEMERDMRQGFLQSLGSAWRVLLTCNGRMKCRETRISS